MDDPEHALLRRMVNGAFTVKRIEALRPVVQEMVDDFIDRMPAGPTPADLVQALALPIPSLVISQMLGVPYEDHEFFQTNSKTLVSAVATPEERQGAHANLGDYLDRLVGRKLADPGDDLLSHLADRIKAGELTRRGAASMGVPLLLGGHETTANMISLGTLLLLQHPDQLARIRDTDDPKAVVSAVEELLRHLSIGHLGRRRTALEDIGIAGRTIRAGEGVILSASSPTGTRPSSLTPTASTSPATRATTRPSARAPTTASAGRRPGWSSRWCTRCTRRSSAASRPFAWPRTWRRPPSSTTPSSTAPMSCL